MNYRDRPANPFSFESSDGYLWLKCNFHAHTTRSDGRVSPQERVDGYIAEGYDVLALTDHNTITPVDSVAVPEDFTLIQGVELHPDNPFGGSRHHFLALNVIEDMDARSMPPQHVIDAVHTQGGSIWLAHPYWSSVNILRDTLPLRGLDGIEVFNTACRVAGRGDSSILWDDWMDLSGELLPAIATDDSHARPNERMADTYQSWTMVRVKERTPQAIVDAIVSGHSYASTGPTIHDVSLERKQCELENEVIIARVRCSPCQRVFAIANLRGTEYHCQGQLFEEAVFELRKGITHVRFEFIGEDGCKAWTNPFDVRDL